MKIARTLLVTAALAGALTACASTNPPKGCPDTAPRALTGVVSGKQTPYKNDAGVIVDDRPAIVASNGDECWYMQIQEDGTNRLWSIHVSRKAYQEYQQGSKFSRNMDATS